MKYSSAFRLVIIVCLTSACSLTLPSVDKNDLPVSSKDTPSATQMVNQGDFEIGEAAYIDSIDTVFLESFPIQVHAVLKGNFPDGCTTIQRHEVEREGNTFLIKIFTQRPVDAFCTEALVPFEFTVPLDVYGLPADTYIAKAYNAAAEFTFSQNNIPQKSGGG